MTPSAVLLSLLIFSVLTALGLVTLALIGDRK